MFYKFFQITTFILMSSSAFAWTPTLGETRSYLPHEQSNDALSGIEVYSIGPYVGLKIIFAHLTSDEFREYSEQFTASLSRAVEQLEYRIIRQQDRWKFTVGIEDKAIDASIHIIDRQDVFFESFFDLVFNKISERLVLTSNYEREVFTLLRTHRNKIVYTKKNVSCDCDCNCENIS